LFVWAAVIRLRKYTHTHTQTHTRTHARTYCHARRKFVKACKVIDQNLTYEKVS
jgi:hypothetical protein